MDYWTHSATAHAGDPEAGRVPSKTNTTKEGGPVINGGLDLHVGGADFGRAGELDLPVWNASGQYSSDLFARVAGDWIAEHGATRSSTPMFLYLAFQGCHSGDNAFVQAPPDIMERFEKISPQATCGSWQRPQAGSCTLPAMRKSVAAIASSVDDAIGSVVASLKKASMYDDSLIVLSTDNGGPTDGGECSSGRLGLLPRL